jgi:ribonuclease P/MRP protein subunit POP5
MGNKLLPTERDKKRYLVFEVISDREIAVEDAYREIRQSYLRLFGQIDLARSKMTLIKERMNSRIRKGVIRINNLFSDKLRLSLAFVVQVKEDPAIIRSAGASGILKKACEKFMQPDHV